MSFTRDHRLLHKFHLQMWLGSHSTFKKFLISHKCKKIRKVKKKLVSNFLYKTRMSGSSRGTAVPLLLGHAWSSLQQSPPLPVVSHPTCFSHVLHLLDAINICDCNLWTTGKVLISSPCFYSLALCNWLPLASLGWSHSCQDHQWLVIT